MISILIHSSETFSVDHDDVHVFVGSAGDSFFPEPKSFSTGIDGGSYLEATFFLIEEDSVDEEGFACSVLADYGTDA